MGARYRGVLFDLFGTLVHFDAGRLPTLAVEGQRLRTTVGGLTALLEEYRRATEAHDVAALAAMYVSFRPEQRILLERYFATVRDLKVRLEDVDVAISGDEAIASYTRVDDFVDIPTQRPQHLSLRVTRTLRRVDGRWRFASVQ